MIVFETAVAADIPVIYAQAKELIDTYEDISAIEYEKVLAWVERKITQHIGEYQCANLDGEKAGFFRLCPDGEIDDLYVLPQFRGKGIGSQILHHCIDKSEKSLYLYAFTGNVRAIAFYQRFGFSVRESVGKTRCIMTRKG